MPVGKGSLEQKVNLTTSYQLSRWQGKGQEEKGIDKATGKVRVEVDPKYYRPTEVVSLI